MVGPQRTWEPLLVREHGRKFLKILAHSSTGSFFAGSVMNWPACQSILTYVLKTGLPMYARLLAGSRFALLLLVLPSHQTVSLWPFGRK